MPIVRIAICDVCRLRLEETAMGDGFKGWGQLSGIVLDGVENPMLCPEHLAPVANKLDSLRKETNGLD